jgi:putative membrane protein
MSRAIRALLCAHALALSSVQCTGGSGSVQAAAVAPVASVASVAPGQPRPSGGVDPTAGDASGPADAEDPGWADEASRNVAGAGDDTNAAIVLTDPEIAAIVDAVHTAEMDQATLAQTRSTDERVQNFAAIMLSHHGRAQQEQSKLNLSKAESPLSTQLAQDARAVLIGLRQKSGKDFDRAYLQSQIDEHQMVLALLDGELIPNAQSPKLARYLRSIRPRLVQHLQLARASLQAVAADAQSSLGPRGRVSLERSAWR